MAGDELETRTTFDKQFVDCELGLDQHKPCLSTESWPMFEKETDERQFHHFV